MRRVNVLLFSEPAGGIRPFALGELQVVFHVLAEGPVVPPVLEGNVWVFVDWVLPGVSGLEICRRLRCHLQMRQTHVTLILDDDDPEAARRALRAGADDYLIGPSQRAALIERVLAVQPANLDGGGQRLGLGELVIDLAAFQARWRKMPISLMPNEFRLLRFLIEHPGRVFTRTQLIAALGKQDPPVDARTVDVWIGRLRRALKAVGAGYSAAHRPLDRVRARRALNGTARLPPEGKPGRRLRQVRAFRT